MSIWTHVVGCIRVDGHSSMGVEKRQIEQILGPMLRPEGNWSQKGKLPCGSEGSLEYRIIEYYTGLPWLAIPIWGDLRDYDNKDEIVTWWLETLKAIDSTPCMIRDAILQIRVGEKTFVLPCEGEVLEL